MSALDNLFQEMKAEVIAIKNKHRIAMLNKKFEKQLLIEKEALQLKEAAESNLRERNINEVDFLDNEFYMHWQAQITNYQKICNDTLVIKTELDKELLTQKTMYIVKSSF